MITSTPQRKSAPVVLMFIAALLACAEMLYAQPITPVLDEESAGTHYLIAYPDTTANALDSRYPNNRVRSEFSIWIYSAVNNRVKISSGSGASQVLNLKGGIFEIHTFRGAPSITTINTPISNTFKLESDFPIIIHCYLATIQGLEVWTPIPVDRWGTRYHAAAVPGEAVLEIGLAQEVAIPHTVKPGSAEILVIAAYDNTRITFRPPPGTDFVGGPPREITLHEGQAYQVQSIVDPVSAEEGEPQQDIAGTVITSDKPIGVLSGNTRAMVNKDEAGLKNNAYKNMLMEWLAPSEQHGKEFVFMPTWDNLRSGSGAAAERKREFIRMYGTQGRETKGYHLQQKGTAKTEYRIALDTLREFAIDSAAAAIYFKTESPVQAMMHSSAVVKFNGSTPCFGGIPCLSYDAWAPYMVEMTPREQWTTFAPYYAPPNPGGMAHYINVVTDTASANAGNIVRKSGAPFIFNRKIPGTDLIWGSMSVNPGVDEFLIGKNGARFGGFVYGLKQGYEEYRPGRTVKKEDDKHAVASGGGKDRSPMPLHPCEYEEYNAVSYGYPLAPRRQVLMPSDSVEIDTTMDCGRLTVTARAVNAEPVGFRSARLDPVTVKNARLVPVDPGTLDGIVGTTRFDVRIEPVDPLNNASATLVIVDRTGKVWRVDYTYDPERIESDSAASVDFGAVLVNTDATRTVTFTNPMARPLVVKQVLLTKGNRGYTIVSTNPEGPAKTPAEAVTLQPGGKMTVVVRTKPTEENRIYVDTLKVVLSCASVTLPLTTESVRPIIRVSDIDFGVFIQNDPAKLDSFRICNEGSGVLTFDNPNDPAATALLTWTGTRFTVDPQEISKLKTTQLGQNECIWVKVTFTPDQLGDYREVARVWGSTRYIRDTSIWRAKTISLTTGVNERGGTIINDVQAVTSGNMVEIRCALAQRAYMRLEIYDVLGKRMDLIADEERAAGEHTVRWDASKYPSGIYYCRISGDGWSRMLPLVVRR